MKKLKLKYRFKVQHNVSFFVYIKLWLKTFINIINAWSTSALPKSELYTFVVGCGNSGTTLLASKLGLHTKVLLINRESNLFFPSRKFSTAKIICNEWLELALQENKASIIEKSPKHVHCSFLMRRLLPNCRFIVVTRNPLDTCASLYKRMDDLTYAIDRWNMDNLAATKVLKLGNTLHVSYESLTQSPEKTLQEVCHFLGIDWQDEILSTQGSKYGSAHDIRPNMAIRHAQVSKPISQNSNGWMTTFTPEQARLVAISTSKVARLLGYSTPSTIE